MHTARWLSVRELSRFVLDEMGGKSSFQLLLFIDNLVKVQFKGLELYKEIGGIN